MKKLSNLITTLLMLSITAPLQAQMKNWFIAPNKVDVQTNNVVVTAIAGSPDIATQVANGVYDSGNNLVFYIADNKVYDYNNTLLGTIITGGAEVIIVPFGTNDTITNCQRKYNIFSTWGGVNSITGLYRAVVDMNSLSVTTWTNALVEVQFNGGENTEFGAIALGLPHGVDQERYLYFMAGSGTLTLGPSGSGQIHKVIVNNDGTVTVPVNTSQIYPTTPLDNDGSRIFSRELELSADGKWLAWASYVKGNYGGGFPTQQRYHYLALDGNGDADVTAYGANVYQEFNIPGANYNLSTSGFRGVEFYQNGNTTKLFVGAGTDGIYSVDVAIPYNTSQSPYQIGSSNPDYGFSQIELAYNGNMYASSTSNTQVGAFDPFNPTPVILGTPTSFLFTNPPKADYTLGGVNPNSTLYTLPDQIDGQDYSSITPSVAPQVVTTHTLNYPDNTNTNQSTTWSYGTSNNPLGVSVPIHVTGELRIRQNSNLTISGMTLKFSPEAKVIVEPGSTLTLTDGTLLTSNYMEDPCNVAYTWQGVEVWGSQSNQSQNIMPLAVGKLIMNNSTIEYAICGARAQKFYYPTHPLLTGSVVCERRGCD